MLLDRGGDPPAVSEAAAALIPGAPLPGPFRPPAEEVAHPPTAAIRPILATAAEATETLWHPFRRSALAGGFLCVVALDVPGGAGASWDDFALFGSVPRARVVAPPDVAGVLAAWHALERIPGPTYLRIPAEEVPTAGGGSFAFGIAPELRGGSDLTMIGVGRGVSLALGAAEVMGRQGVSVRVLDGSSVKPGDPAAFLRAARETRGIVVIEEQLARTGVGSFVAATVSESAPIPIRRVGIPDLPPSDGRGAALLGVTLERVVEEATALLRSGGKLH
jgi:transketolase C-terminal domain/subunit